MLCRGLWCGGAWGRGIPGGASLCDERGLLTRSGVMALSPCVHHAIGVRSLSATVVAIAPSCVSYLTRRAAETFGAHPAWSENCCPGVVSWRAGHYGRGRRENMPGRKPRQGGDGPPVVFDRRMMEQQMQAITRLLAGQEFASADEANAFLDQQLAGGQPPAFAPETSLERAQDVVYRAMEATGARRQRLAREALAISPDCADAYVLLAEEARDPQEAKRLYEEGVRAGERAIGPAAFRDDVGY